MPIIEIYHLYLVKINSFQLISICFSAQHPLHSYKTISQGGPAVWTSCLNIMCTTDWCWFSNCKNPRAATSRVKWSWRAFCGGTTNCCTYVNKSIFAYVNELKFSTKKVEKRCFTTNPFWNLLFEKISIRNIFYILSSFATPHWHYPSDILDPSFG